MRTYVIARLTLKMGMHARYAEIFGSAVVPALQAQGMKLAGAYFPVIGERSEVLHVWEVPDPNAWLQALGAAMLGDEAMMAILPDLEDCIVTETLSVVTDAPYAQQ